jgi:hypothetical protein
MRYTRPEAAAIHAAWQAISHLCECTNWSDAGEWKEAERLERAQFRADDQPTLAARAMACSAWARGLDSPDARAREFYMVRPGYLRAMLLGVRHAVERAGDDYTGPMVAEARTLCCAAVVASNSHTRRLVGESVP